MDRWIVDGEVSTRYPIYTRGNIGEVFPLPVTPLTWTYGALPCSELGWRDAFVRYGAFDADEFSDDGPEILGCFGGYGYLNVSITRIFGVRTPGLTPEQVDYSLWGEMAGVPPYAPQPTDDSLSHTDRVNQTLGWILSVSDLPELVADQAEMAALRASRPDFATLTDGELWAFMQSLGPTLRRLFSEHIFISYCALVPVGIIAATCQALGDPTHAMRLVAGLGEVDSAVPSWALWELGRQVAASPALSAVFDVGVEGLLERLGPDTSEFRAAFDRFLYDYGSRGPNEWEMSSPSWETRPELALAAVHRMRLSPDDAAPEEQQARLIADRQQLAAELIPLLDSDPEAQGQFAAAISAAKVFLPGRERSKTNVIRLVNEIRLAANELGQRMVDAGHIDRREDVSMLTVDEVRPFVTDPASFSSVIRARAAAYAKLFDLEPPFIITGHVPPLEHWARRDRVVSPATSGTTLVGIPGCPGRAEGRARIILDPGDPFDLQPGDVLVAPITDPAWTPLFVGAAAVIVDVGAQVSHAVIVSRELGVPCVVSVTDATRKIPNGAQVVVDGTAGVVTVV